MSEKRVSFTAAIAPVSNAWIIFPGSSAQSAEKNSLPSRSSNSSRDTNQLKILQLFSDEIIVENKMKKMSKFKEIFLTFGTVTNKMSTKTYHE